MALPTFGSASTMFEAFNQTTNTKSFTLTAGRQLGVAVYHNADVAVSSAVWNTSEALTLVGSGVQGSGARLKFYTLKNGTSGTHDVVITFASDPNVCGIVVFDYADVNTTTDFDSGTVSAANGGSSSPSATVGSVASGDLVIAVLACGGDSNVGTYSASNGSVRAARTASAFGGLLITDRASSGSVQVNGTLGASDNWVFIAADFNASAAGISSVAAVQQAANIGGRQIVRALS